MHHAVHQYCIEVAGCKTFNYVTLKILVKQGLYFKDSHYIKLSGQRFVWISSTGNQFSSFGNKTFWQSGQGT
jgi:hypothetical protein